MNQFNPRRLTLARQRRGYSKSQLAVAADVSLRAISSYENGSAPPSEAMVSKLAVALGFPREFFHGDDLIEFSPDAGSFRAMSRMSAAQKDSVLAAAAFAVTLNRFLEARLDLPSMQVPDLRDEDPAAAAAALRTLWKQGVRPIGNMVHLLESNGVRVFSLTGEQREVDAFSIWAEGTPFVFLNTLKSGERGRFDAAHELGHLVLHRHGTPNGRAAEDEADRFASAFLMPEANFATMVPQMPTVDRLLPLKEVWKVSVAAVARRIYDLALTTRWHYEQMCKEISKRGWRTAEPAGIVRETSQLLSKAFGFLREDGISRHDVARELRLSVDDLDRLIFQLVPTAVDGGRTGPSIGPTNRGHLRLVSQATPRPSGVFSPVEHTEEAPDLHPGERAPPAS